MIAPAATISLWDEVDLNLLHCVMVCTTNKPWRQRAQIFNQVNEMLGRPHRTEPAMQMQWRRSNIREQSQTVSRPRRTRNGSDFGLQAFSQPQTSTEYSHQDVFQPPGGSMSYIGDGRSLAPLYPVVNSSVNAHQPENGFGWQGPASTAQLPQPEHPRQWQFNQHNTHHF
ncbi:hypothetical protein XPA_010492 [Xanthoria parietina]